MRQRRMSRAPRLSSSPVTIESDTVRIGKGALFARAAFGVEGRCLHLHRQYTCPRTGVRRVSFFPAHRTDRKSGRFQRYGRFSCSGVEDGFNQGVRSPRSARNLPGVRILSHNLSVRRHPWRKQGHGYGHPRRSPLWFPHGSVSLRRIPR